MKNYFFLLAVMFVSAVALPACSDDDNDAPDDPSNGENGVVVSEKKLVKMVAKSDDDSWSETITFSYDNKGRLTAAKYVDDQGYFENSNFVWGNNEIEFTITYESGYHKTGTIIIENGLVQSEYENSGDTYNYTYNSSNRLNKVIYGDGTIEVSAIWDGDKLLSDGDGTTFTYGKSCENGYSPTIPVKMSPGLCPLLFVAHPELAGLRTSQCPTSETYSEGDGYDDYWSFEYEFDANGYISKVLQTYTYSYSDQTDKSTITFTWE